VWKNILKDILSLGRWPKLRKQNTAIPLHNPQVQIEQESVGQRHLPKKMDNVKNVEKIIINLILCCYKNYLIV